MNGTKLRRFLPAVVFIVLFPGCLFTSKSRLNESQAQNRILSEQNSAQLTEIEMLKTHGRDVENKLIRSEQELSALKDQLDINRRQLADYEREHALLYEQFKQLARSGDDAQDQGARSIK